MSLYLDTSLLVTYIVTEPGGAEVDAWMRRQDTTQLFVSGWVATEFASALALKVRSGTLADEASRLARRLFQDLWRSTFGIYPVTDANFQEAAAMCAIAELGLRSGDALHLAVAAAHGASVCTRDRGMAQAGAALGVDTRLISS